MVSEFCRQPTGDKLKTIQAEADAGLKTSATYTLAVDDWAARAGDSMSGRWMAGRGLLHAGRHQVYRSRRAGAADRRARAF